MKWNDPEATQEAARYNNPIPSRTLISQTVGQAERALTQAELISQFGLTDEETIEALSRRLIAMVRDGQLIRQQHTFLLASDAPEHDATIQVNLKGLGFAVIDDAEDFVLPERELRFVFHGDRVKVRATGLDRKNKQQGFITEVVHRQVKQIIGHVAEHEGEFYVQPSGIHAHQPITLEKPLIEHAKVHVGDAIRIAIDDYPTRETFATGHVVQTLKDQADTEIIIPTTILEYGLNDEFPEAAIKQAEKYKEPTAKDLKNREDLRQLPLVTIDGEDARDFDDAVFAERTEDGGFRLIVAIADVSHYVTVDSALDVEAVERGTSVYFPHFVLPMLPEHLSNGPCSLNPNKDRLSMVCDLTLSKSGEVKDYRFYPAVIHSHARLTYTQVGDYLAGNTSQLPNITAVRESVDTLNRLYKTMLKVRKRRHALEFDTVETFMTFDELGGLSQILPRTRNDAHRLIEECMLLANVAAADLALKNDLDILYRVHEPPEFSRVEKVRQFLKLLGLNLPEKPTQADYQAVIEKSQDLVNSQSIHAMLLRSMMQAYYSPHNQGHYGLAYDAYTHFTSPIRRYPDLLLHRAIKAYLTKHTSPISGAALDAAGEHFSYTERRADDASRSVVSWLKCHYMQQHIGEVFKGQVSAVTEFGLFINLNQVYIDGMLHISQLGNDYFVYDQRSQSLIGQSHGQQFKLGDAITIKVAAVSLEERKIDFELATEPKPRAKKSAAPRTKKPKPKAKKTPTGKSKAKKST